MSEDLIIKHCSPTLAGLKTANLFTCVYSQKQDVERYAQEFNRRFSCKGVKMQPLDFGKTRALIYVFRPTRLERDLSDPLARSILASMGYTRFDYTTCLNRLKSRVKRCPCKCCGCWKVYGNEEKARCAFAKYKKCSDIYYSKWLQGTSINKLIVKAA